MSSAAHRVEHRPRDHLTAASPQPDGSLLIGSSAAPLDHARKRRKLLVIDIIVDQELKALPAPSLSALKRSASRRQCFAYCSANMTIWHGPSTV